MAEEEAIDTEGGGDAPQPRKPNARDAVREAERIQMLRDRLYERGKVPEVRGRHALGRPEAMVDIRTSPTSFIPSSVGQETAQRSQTSQVAPPESTPRAQTAYTTDTRMPLKKKRSYRVWMVLFGLAFFLVSLSVASFYLFRNTNTVGGNNIGVNVSGPITVGGGDELSLQIAIANQNTVPIEAATLVIEYPRGTQSADGTGRALYTERQQLNNIGAGELVNVPVKARVFGEENEEKTVHVTVEYRVAGSNGTFTKEADPFNFRIGTSPINLTIDTVASVSSGQEVELTIGVESNTSATIENLLVKATYPQGFDLTSATPDTISGQDTWRVDELKSGEKKQITVHGILSGIEHSRAQFSVAAGVPGERDAFALASQLAVATHDVEIELPFLKVNVAINSSKDDVVVIAPDDDANVTINFTNVLDTSLFNGKVTATLSGSALDEVEVKVINGYYDSRSNTITWDPVVYPSLQEITPGKTNSATFSLTPRADISVTPTIELAVSVEAERVFEEGASEHIAGSASRTIKVETIAELSSSALYSDGPFINTGPVPPVAEETTEYTYLLTVRNGTNAITGAEVTAVLPPLVTWLDHVSEGDAVTFNNTTRTMKWTIGELPPNGYAEMWAQVSFTPSLSQKNTIPALLQEQRLKATDKFTGTSLRDNAPALTTELINDPNPANRDGRVRVGR